MLCPERLSHNKATTRAVFQVRAYRHLAGRTLPTRWSWKSSVHAWNFCVLELLEEGRLPTDRDPTADQFQRQFPRYKDHHEFRKLWDSNHFQEDLLQSYGVFRLHVLIFWSMFFGRPLFRTATVTVAVRNKGRPKRTVVVRLHGHIASSTAVENVQQQYTSTLSAPATSHLPLALRMLSNKPSPAQKHYLLRPHRVFRVVEDVEQLPSPPLRENLPAPATSRLPRR